MPDCAQQSPAHRLQVVGSLSFCRHVQRYLRRRPEFEVLKPFIIPKADDNLALSIYGAQPDLALLDLDGPGLEFQIALVQLENFMVDIPLVLMARRYHPDLTELSQSQHFGTLVKGTLLYEMLPTPILPLVLAGVAQGCTYFLPDPDKATDQSISPYQLMLLRLLALGMSNQEIADSTPGGSINSVYSALSRIRRTLEVDTTSQALVVALRLGIVAQLAEDSESRLGAA